MMKLVTGAEIAVGALGLLFEAGKLTSFAMFIKVGPTAAARRACHRRSHLDDR
jgi:hypothetical protein